MNVLPWQDITPGKGRRAVVYNSPDFHLTGVSMFSCALMSLGFHVTAVVKVCPCRKITVAIVLLCSGLFRCSYAINLWLLEGGRAG